MDPRRSPMKTAPRAWARARFVTSWLVALTLVAVALPRVLDVSWPGVVPVLASVSWPAIGALLGLWLLGLYVHSFVLTAAAPSLTHRRALALNMSGSAIANVVPLGGAAGIELNRRMMKAWGIAPRDFTGYTFLTNLWDVAAKLLLPVIAAIVLVRADGTLPGSLRTASLFAGLTFVGLATSAAVLLLSQRGTQRLGRVLERSARAGLRLVGRDRPLGLPGVLANLRRDCAGLVASGWLRMSGGIGGYLALQWVLLAFCLHLTGAGNTWQEVLAAFAMERLLTVVPLTPGGVGAADLGLIGVLLALGGDPVGITAAAVLYRLFIFAVEIPVGSGVLGLWLLAQRRSPSPAPARVRTPAQRIAHVTDVYLPRLGGIETHVDDLVRHQRTAGLDAHVLTPTTSTSSDPAWVRRLPARRARRVVLDYDLVHVHVSMWSPYGVTVARAAMRAGIPTLVTVHSMWAGAGGLLRLLALTSLRRWPVAWSAVSTAAAASFRRSLPHAEVAVLPNAIDVSEWRQRTGETGGSDASASEPVVLISVMRLMPRKRPLALLRMLQQVRQLTPAREVRLVIVGDGPLLRRTERAARRLGLADAVRIAGRIPRTQVREELSGASIYVAPAAKESFGIAALEARSTGLPVVANRSSGVSEFIRDRVDGMLVADDTEMIVAIADLISDPELAARIAEHNRRVAPKHDWGDALAQTAVLYDEAARRAGASALVPAPALIAARA